jgi:Zn-dependent oligopeptidase
MKDVKMLKGYSRMDSPRLTEKDIEIKFQLKSSMNNILEGLFTVEGVLSGLFELAKILFGVEMKKVTPDPGEVLL